MIPRYSRVVAIDDDEDHLQKIVWGLGKAGFCAIPFFFDDGKLEDEPSAPLPGIRLVFTDIHMVGGGQHNDVIHATNIVKCLKKIVGTGPYVLIFWSQFPDEKDRIGGLINERSIGAKLNPPIGYGAINKNDVFNLESASGEDAFNASRLRDLILEAVQSFRTIAVPAAWENRVAQAAATTTNRLFDLVKASGTATDDWEQLFACLACEAVGHHQARENPTDALDEALLPLLEDQLSVLGDGNIAAANSPQWLRDLLNSERSPRRPRSVSTAQLNTSYLIEQFNGEGQPEMWERGVVTALGPAFLNSGPFVRAFGLEATELIRDEFATRTDMEAGELAQTKLHIVELGPECDHVQGKMKTHRYLLALLVPDSLIDAFSGQQKRGTKAPSNKRYGNESVMDVGRLALESPPLQTPGDWHLLVSCRRFMSLAVKTKIDGTPRFRLRRALMEEVAHRYATHARRPGVMRFYD
ncbi:hypothetical protein [Ralstonia sp. NFACC01]|uniref:hypothetical protein n=1 Tax=Ralstonia sp. NFACC01 TaxID=1566294 RepID=UPI0008EDA300|nr:hypothetical protein [Ralstonia sp. NFACC01]SFP97701.1 hypothetical protein SAMN03159417_03848 [Ralstonia sp. NFACC01]